MAPYTKFLNQRFQLSLSVMLICVISLVYGESTRNDACILSIPNNKTLFEKLDEHYEEDATTIIIEYTISFNNVSSDFDLANRSSADLFQPLRWFSTQGLSSSRLLLTYSFLYGTLKFILSLGIESKDLPIDVSPPGCVENYEQNELEIFIRDFLIEALNVRQQPVIDLYFCKAHIGGKNGKGFLIHRCCNLDRNHEIHCQDVTIDHWVEYLHIFIMIMVSIFACILPDIMLIPYRVARYKFTTPKAKKFEFCIQILPKQEVEHAGIDQRKTIDFNRFVGMNKFTEKLNRYPEKDVKTFKIQVKEAVLEMPKNKIFTLGRTEFSFQRALSELAMKCLRFCSEEQHWHNDYCSLFCCCKETCYSIFPLLFVMIVLALPSGLIMYSIWVDDLWYKELDRAYRKRGLSSPFNLNFYLCKLDAYIFVLFLAFFYLVHFVLIIFSSKVRHFYTSMVNDNFFKTCIEKCLEKQGRETCVKKMCFVLLHILKFILKIPLFNIIIEFVVVSVKKRKYKTCIENFLLFPFGISAFFVIIVLILDAMFLSGVLVMLVVTVTFEGETMYTLIPVLFWLAVYLWSSLRNLHKPFDVFMGTLLETDICQDLFIDRQDERPNNDDIINCFHRETGFRYDNNALKLNITHPLVDVYRSGISKEFFYQCAKIDHVDAPGSALKNNLKAGLLFIKLAAFIFFVYLVLMAYGNVVYISATNRVFLTFVAGILPIIYDKLYGDNSSLKKINPLDKRLIKELGKKMRTFKEKWIVHDFTAIKLLKVTVDEKEIDLSVIKRVASPSSSIEVKPENLVGDTDIDDNTTHHDLPQNAASSSTSIEMKFENQVEDNIHDNATREDSSLNDKIPANSMKMSQPLQVQVPITDDIGIWQEILQSEIMESDDNDMQTRSTKRSHTNKQERKELADNASQNLSTKGSHTKKQCSKYEQLIEMSTRECI